MRIDCHCHILPEIDDGASCIEVSAEFISRPKRLAKTRIGSRNQADKYAYFDEQHGVAQ